TPETPPLSLHDALPIWAKREDRAARTHCHELLDVLDLRPYKDQPVRTLPYGVKKRVDLGRALAAEPSLLLLDEPVAGMNSDESRSEEHTSELQSLAYLV